MLQNPLLKDLGMDDSIIAEAGSVVFEVDDMLDDIGLDTEARLEVLSRLFEDPAWLKEKLNPVLMC